MGIVAHADGVTSHILQLFQTSFPHRNRNGSAQAAGVVVNTNAFYQHIFVIQVKACICIKTDTPDTHPAAVNSVGYSVAGLAGNTVSRADPGFQSI